jgi:hypothetical protein
MLRIKQKIKFIKLLIKFFVLISVIEIIYLIIKSINLLKCCGSTRLNTSKCSVAPGRDRTPSYPPTTASICPAGSIASRRGSEGGRGPVEKARTQTGRVNFGGGGGGRRGGRCC